MYYGSDTLLGDLHMLAHFSLRTKVGLYHYPPFITDEATETQRGARTLLRSQPLMAESQMQAQVVWLQRLSLKLFPTLSGV